MKFKIQILMLFICAFSCGVQAYTIGVLAKRGAAHTLKQWEPTSAYLNTHIAGQDFHILPLGFDEIQRAVVSQEVDFVLANSAFYVELESRYGISRIATLKNLVAPGQSQNRFGGVIFTRTDTHWIHSLGDLHGRRFAAVDARSFGGWHMAWRELLEHNLNPYTELAALKFVGTHDEVVYAVRDGRVDAGTVRTDTLERMAEEGKILLDQFKILESRHYDGFPLHVSTRLYPEWPFARTAHVSDRLAEQVAIALLEMPPDHPAAVAAKSRGWTIPLNYQPVHDCLRVLKIGPYSKLNEFSLCDVWQRYKFPLLIFGLFLFISCLASLYVIRLNRHLRQHQTEIDALNRNLEQRVETRTHDIHAGLIRERRLRAVLSTVADVNQILITSTNLNTLLESCCNRLIHKTSYSFAGIGLVDANHPLYPAAWASRNANVPLNVASFLDVENPDEFSKTLVGRALSNNMSIVCRNFSADSGCGLYAEAFASLGLSAAVALPLRSDTHSVGVLITFSTAVDGFEFEELRMLEELAGDIGFAINAFRQKMRAERLQSEKIRNYEESILAMIEMIEKRDTYTAGHSKRVAVYSARIAKRMNLSQENQNRLTRAAILHDIGKIATPDTVLLKPGQLTPLEYDLIKQHVTAGYELLSKIASYRDLAEIMRHHHERYDGNGYPDGLRGDEIPLLARVISVADAFDAMTSCRIYKPRRSIHDALTELKRGRGKQFDPQIVTIAIEVLQNVEVPDDADQTPKTELEKERFAYFFNDQLTGIYNSEYLQFLMRTGAIRTYPYIWVVYLTNFTAFNRAHGWHEGDQVLIKFASCLQQNYPDSMSFRVQGDDFIILSRVPIEIKEHVLRDSCIPKPEIGLHIQRVEPAVSSTLDQMGVCEPIRR